MTRTDRRKQRTREVLQKALVELIGEYEYDTITIQDIVDRANVGRTTFYLHYDSKEELFMSCHEAIVGRFHVGLFQALSREETLLDMTSTYRHLEEDRELLYPIFQGKDSQLILRRIRDRNAGEIEENLRTAFAEADSGIPLDILANYLAGAQIALMQWWLEKRRPHSPHELVQTLHRLQRMVIESALASKRE